MKASVLAVLAVGACADAGNESSPDAAARDPGRPTQAVYADTVSIASRVDSMERLVRSHPERLKLFASVAGREGLVAVPDSTSWPDEVETSYNIVFDSAGTPLLHRQMPSSESGDWFRSITHYFAPDGRTILFEDEISGFNECTRVLRERTRIFLDPVSGRQLAFSRTFADRDNKPFADTSGCFIRGDASPKPTLTSRELLLPRFP